MKTLLLLLLLPSVALAQISVQKASTGIVSNGPIIIGSGNSLTATGTGIITATGISGSSAFILPGAQGGTGVNNTGKTITLGGNLVTLGAFSTTLTATATTSLTLPITGTLATLAGAEAFTNKTYAGSTINLTGTAAFGGTVTAGAANPVIQAVSPTLNNTAKFYVSDSTNIGQFMVSGGVGFLDFPTSLTMRDSNAGNATRWSITSAGRILVNGAIDKGNIFNVVGGDTVPATSGSTQTGGLRISSLVSGSGGYVLDAGVSNTSAYAWLQVSNSANLANGFGKPLVLNPIDGGVIVGAYTSDPGFGNLKVGGSLIVSGAGSSIFSGTLRSDGAGARTAFVTTGGAANLQIYHPASGGVRIFNTGSVGTVFNVDSTGTVAGASLFGTTTADGANQVQVSTLTSLTGLAIHFPVAPTGSNGSALNFLNWTNTASLSNMGRIQMVVTDGSATYAGRMTFLTATSGALAAAMYLENSGMTITSALSLGSTITSTLPTGVVMVATAASTGNKYMRLANTGGDVYFGLESSAGGTIFSGSGAYSTVLGTAGSTSFHLATASTLRLWLTSAGHWGIGAAPSGFSAFDIQNSVSAAAGGGVGLWVRPTLTAVANSDSLYAIHINPTVAKGAFTGLTYIGMWINGAATTGGGTISTVYGLHIAAQSGGSTNYAIYTNTGLVRFGDNVTIAGSTLTLNHDATITAGSGNGPLTLINSADAATLSLKAGTSTNYVAKIDINGGTQASTPGRIVIQTAQGGAVVFDGQTGSNMVLMKVQSAGSSAGNYLSFADANIGGQTAGLAFLRWTRDGGQGRKFSVFVADSGGSSFEGLLVDTTNSTFIGTITKPGGTSPLISTNTSITSGGAAAAGTLTNAPVAGNPTKWVPINDNGTTRYIPAW